MALYLCTSERFVTNAAGQQVYVYATPGSPVVVDLPNGTPADAGLIPTTSTTQPVNDAAGALPPPDATITI